MTDDSTLIGQVRQGLSKRLAEAIVGTLWLLSTGVLLKFEDQAFDLLQRVLDKRGMLLLIALLVFSCAYLLILVLRARYSKSFFDSLVPVESAGYCKDPKTGEAVCPRCAVKQHRSYLRKMERGFYCQVCGASIDE